MSLAPLNKAEHSEVVVKESDDNESFTLDLTKS